MSETLYRAWTYGLAFTAASVVNTGCGEAATYLQLPEDETSETRPLSPANGEDDGENTPSDAAAPGVIDGPDNSVVGSSGAAGSASDTTLSQGNNSNSATDVNDPAAVTSPSESDEVSADDPSVTGGTPRPLFALSSRLRTVDSLVSYLFLADDLSTDLEISDAVLSFDAQTVLAVGPERGGQIYLTTPNRSLTRYLVDPTGNLQQAGAPLDLAGELGGGNFGEYGSAFQFIEPDRAYYFHRDRLILWDPAAMVVTGSVYYGEGPEGGGIYREGYATTFSALPLRDDANLYVVAGWHDAGVILPETAVIQVDLATDEVTIVSDTRCAFAREGAWGPDGKLYLASEAYAAAVFFDDPSKAPPPCLVRFDPATGAFDPNFLEQRLFGVDDRQGQSLDVAFGSLQGGPNGSTFLRVLDPELAVTVVDGPRFLSSAEPVWRWARITLSPGPFVSLLDVAPSGGSAVPLVFGDRIFSPSFTFDWIIEGVVRSAISTEMVELDPSGPTASRFSFPGQSFAAFAVQ